MIFCLRFLANLYLVDKLMKPANLPDCIMDASRGAHVMVRLELAGRFNNELRLLN
jgi:hypothetical protein